MQQVIKGANSLSLLPALLARQGANRILFVTGHHVLEERAFRELMASLTLPYDVIHPEEGVLQIARIPAYETLDTIVSIGGGKVLDFAKGIIFRHKKPVRFIAVPTTAGSGSETTPIAVFYEGKRKVSLDAPHLLPEVAILDRELVQNLPPYQKAVSGADALAQCIESVWNVHSTKTSEDYALFGLDLLWNNLLAFTKDNDGSVTEKVMWGSHLGGKAVTLTRTTAPHALSYYLTANYGVPHGQAVALTLPLFFLYNQTGTAEKQLHKIFELQKVQGAEGAFESSRNLFRQLGLATSLKELGLQQIDLNQWLASVDQQRFGNNPVSFDADRLYHIFQRYL
jgi:alcohol dehydrogenase class IV